MPTILLVDDEVDITDNLKKLFESHNYTVFTASDGQSAINEVKQHSPDLVFLDMDMPTLNGIGVLKFIKKDYPKTKVVVLSGYEAEYRAQIEKIGAESIQAKPYPLNRLIKLTNTILEHKAIPVQENPFYIDPHIMPKAKLLFIEPTALMAGGKLMYLKNTDKCGGMYKCDIITKPGEIEDKLKDFNPDIVLSDISELHSNPSLQAKIMSSKHKPKDMIVYGTDSDYKNKQTKQLKEKLEKEGSIKLTEGGFDPFASLFTKGHIDKLGKIIRETAIDNGLYEKTQHMVRIPCGPKELIEAAEKAAIHRELKPESIAYIAKSIIADSLDINIGQITDDTDLYKDPHVRDVTYIEIRISLEHRLAIEIATKDFEKLHTFKQLVDYLQERVAQEKNKL